MGFDGIPCLNRNWANARILFLGFILFLLCCTPPETFDGVEDLCSSFCVRGCFIPCYLPVLGVHIFGRSENWWRTGKMVWKTGNLFRIQGKISLGKLASITRWITTYPSLFSPENENNCRFVPSSFRYVAVRVQKNASSIILAMKGRFMLFHPMAALLLLFY